MIDRLRGGFLKPVINPATGKPIGGTGGKGGGSGGSTSGGGSSGGGSSTSGTTESGPTVAEEIAELTSNSARYDLRDAVIEAVKLWCLQAHFRNISINAVIATGGPGCLTGPDLADMMDTTPTVAAATGRAKVIAETVADGIGECFDAWRDNVTVPALPWYPAFAAFPGPSAPLMPNVPTPLLTCVSSSADKICNPTNMKNTCYNALPAELKRSETEVMLNLLATELALHFTGWLALKQVMLVMAFGPVPTFAPPYVPVGPVVGGSIVEAPPHLPV